MLFKDRIRDSQSTYGGLKLYRNLSAPFYLHCFLIFSSAFQTFALAKLRTEITGLGPPFPAPSLFLSYSPQVP